ncbi:MAG: hypothetical protein KIT73_20260, partial [Burkholderiales bacterium]|nr:hypothetical protein [Burkholderiales bacterium]
MGKCIDSRGTRRQSGAAVLIILILAGVLGVVFFVNTMSLVPGNRDRDAATRLALQQAKEALIGYAVTYMDTHINDVPGYLPCPESTGPLDPTPPNREGAEAGNCGAKGLNAIGRLPWYSLDIPPPRDGHGECLWYAVSGTFKANVKPDVLNWDSVGRFHIQIPNGPTPPNVADDVDRVVAVVIAPGPPLLNQTRTADANTPQCPGNRVIANYLEDVNATMTTNGNANFLAGTPGSRVINDQFITITSNEIFNALAKRDEFRANLRGFARSVSQCLATFRNVAPADPNGRLPWAASLSAATIPDLASTNYTDISSLRVGRVPFILDDSFTQTRGASNANPLLPI